jgi:hypothetical protein
MNVVGILIAAICACIFKRVHVFRAVTRPLWVKIKNPNAPAVKRRDPNTIAGTVS